MEDEEESTAPSSAVRVALPSREAEPAKKSSERARSDDNVEAAGDDSGVNSDNGVDSDLQEKERRFRESIVQDYPGEPC